MLAATAFGRIPDEVNPIPVAVLAAGRGNRLAPLTDDRPKCLLPIGETSPLALMLGTLDRLAGVSEVVLVLGHARERVESFLANFATRLPVHLIDNARYATTNNILSAHLLANRCAQGMLLVNSDVVCHGDIVRGALSPGAGSFLVVDTTLPPRDEAMKVRFEAGRLVAISKTLDPATADGEYIGITRFDAPGATAFFRATAAILAAGGTDEWYEAAIARAARDVAFGLHPTGGKPWIEIDDHADLERARREVLPLLVSAKIVES